MHFVDITMFFVRGDPRRGAGHLVRMPAPAARGQGGGRHSTELAGGAALPWQRAALARLLADGHEMMLHGYTHLDAGPLNGSLGSRLLRTVYTEREGEFAVLGAAEARRRIELGLAWFGERGWPVSGFVAPAWLLGRQVRPLLAPVLV
jgi:hypothetical protein